MKHKIILLYSWLIRTILFFLPDIPIIMVFRGWLYGICMKKCGKKFQVTHDTIIRCLEYISIGNNCFIGNGCFVLADGPIYIEDDVLIGPHTVIVSGNHTEKNGSFRFGEIKIGEIYISKGCWVGANCSLTMNSHLPECSILAANSVLNKKYYEKNCIYGGAPAKKIKILKTNI